MGRAAPKGLALESDEGVAAASPVGASDTVRFCRFSRGRTAGAGGAAAAGEDGVLASGVGVATGVGASGRIFERHWLSISAAVGVRSGAIGLSPLGGRAAWNEPGSRPSPHDAGDPLRSKDLSLRLMSPPSARPGEAVANGVNGPLRSQLPRSLVRPSPSPPNADPLLLRFLSPPKSDPALSKLRSDGRRCAPGNSGNGPFLLQSLSSRASARSLAT